MNEDRKSLYVESTIPSYVASKTINEKHGLWMPLLVTPEELLAEKIFEEDL
jgi:hypothetical protein